MSASERGPMRAALAAAWTLLLIAAVLWAAVWLISQVWVWLVAAALLIGALTAAWWWLRARRDRW